MQKNDLMRFEHKLSLFGAVPLTSTPFVSMLKEYRSPSDKIVRIIDKARFLPMRTAISSVNQLSLVTNYVALFD